MKQMKLTFDFTGALASSALHRTLARAQSSPAPNTANDGAQQGKFTTGTPHYVNICYCCCQVQHEKERTGDAEPWGSC